MFSELDGDEQWYGQGSIYVISVLKSRWSDDLFFRLCEACCWYEERCCTSLYWGSVCSDQHAGLAHILGRFAAIV